MITASELAGFIAAHAVWCLADADDFTPMLAFTLEDEQRKLERLALDNRSAAVEYGRERLERDPFSAFDGVLAYSGRITVGADTSDAIILEMRSYCFPWAKATIAVPFTPASSGRFRVHPPHTAEWHRCEDFDQGTARWSFFKGVASHEHGSKAWDAAFDETM